MCVCVHQRARVYVVCMRVKTERGGGRGGETWAKFFLENHMNVCVFVFVHI